MAIYEQSLYAVESKRVSSKTQTQSRGMRQGCPISPFLFVLVSHVVTRNVYEDPDCPRGDLTDFVDFMEILYADDTVLMSKSSATLQTLLHLFEKHAAEVGLTLKSRHQHVSH